MKYKLFISHICCVFMVHPSGLKVASAYVFQVILMKPVKGLTRKELYHSRQGYIYPTIWLGAEVLRVVYKNRPSIESLFPPEIKTDTESEYPPDSRNF